MGDARHPRDDARFDRARRGRPDPPAGRASRGVARDPEPATCSARATRSRPSNAGNWRCRMHDAPSVLALTRQNLPQLRLGYDDGNRCAAGAYEIAPAEKKDRRSLAVRDRIGSRDRGRGAQAAARARRRRARRFGALLRALPRPACRRAAESRRQPPRSRSRSRPRCGKAGTRSSARTASLSA